MSESEKLKRRRGRPATGSTTTAIRVPNAILPTVLELKAIHQRALLSDGGGVLRRFQRPPKQEAAHEPQG